MKRLSLIAFLASGVFAQTAGTRVVYLLPMAGGLDQYLASWITREHILQVTADPKSADLVLTDKLGGEFEHKLDAIRPRDEEEESDTPNTGFHTTRGRGTVFLVDAKTRNVVWSDAQKPGDGSAAKLNREAHRLARHLQVSLAK